jgi:hypothetical protein
MRSILVFDTTTNKATPYDNLPVNTWGELQTHLRGWNSSMIAMIKENKTNLEHKDAELPVGIGKDARGNSNGKDFTLFLLASKVKSGDNSPIAEKLEELKSIRLDIINDISTTINEKFDEIQELLEELEDNIDKELDEEGELSRQAEEIKKDL